VERLTTSGARLTVSGWAADASGGRVADWVLVFSKQRLVAAGFPNIERRDIAKQYGAAVALAGFWFSAPIRRPDRFAEPSKLRVIALAEDRASELELIEQARRRLK
jgi:hypothetical protein